MTIIKLNEILFYENISYHKKDIILKSTKIYKQNYYKLKNDNNNLPP